MVMKQFNLEEYLANPKKKVVTRDGRNVKIHCTDYIEAQHIIAKIENYSYSTSFYNDGKYCSDKSVSHLDLFFAPEKHEGWLNVYRNTDTGTVGFGAKLYTSREEAEKSGKTSSYYVATAKIEWEE